MPSGRFAGQVAVVTGAASGIGRGSAERLAGEGASVVVVDINGQGAQRVADSFQDVTGQVVSAYGGVSVVSTVRPSGGAGAWDAGAVGRALYGTSPDGMLRNA